VVDRRREGVEHLGGRCRRKLQLWGCGLHCRRDDGARGGGADSATDASTVVAEMAVVGATEAEEDMVSDTSLLRRALLQRKNGGKSRDRGLFSRLRRVGAVAAGEERLGRQQGDGSSLAGSPRET
jgi:hypothetical protein